MTRDLTDYFERRIAEEEYLAATLSHPDVKARHAEFAETYRRRLANDGGRRDLDDMFPA